MGLVQGPGLSHPPARWQRAELQTRAPHRQIYHSGTHVLPEGQRQDPDRPAGFSPGQWEGHLLTCALTLLSGKATGSLAACTEVPQNLAQTRHGDLLLCLLLLI